MSVCCRKCGSKFVQLEIFGIVHPVRAMTLTNKGVCPDCKRSDWYIGPLSKKAIERCRERLRKKQ